MYDSFQVPNEDYDSAELSHLLLTQQSIPSDAEAEVLSWTSRRPSRPLAWWDGPDWADLDAECPCEDCHSQLASTSN